MLTFAQSRRRQHVLGSKVTEQNETLAAAIYAGVTGIGTSHNDLVTTAVADTMPMEYAVLLGTEDIPAAFATACQLEAFQHRPAPGSPWEARRIAEDGWRRFRVLADQAGHHEHGLGGDLSDPWAVTVTVREMQPDPAKMRRIADLAGRMYRALKGAKAKRVEGVPEEVVGVETGGDFPALLPSEYAMLATDPTKRHLFAQVLGRRAQQFQRVGTERKGRGPLVVALDESGSMEGQRDEWAKAAMTALTRLAWEEKRPVVVVHFSTATKAQILMPGDGAGVVRAQHTFLDGGTAIGAALRVGIDEVQNLAQRGHRGADVVLVSDGGDAGGRVTDALDEMQKAGTRLWSIAIDVPFNGPLRERASEYVHLSDADMTSVDGALKVGKAVL